MDVNPTGTAYVNVMYTVYDFTGASDISIDFWEYDSGDEETEPAPDSWVGWGDYDVVAFTCDFNTWYEIIPDTDLNNANTWEHFTYNISSDPDICSEIDDSFTIAFQQIDNWNLINDGRIWDDIYINFTGIDEVNGTDWIEWTGGTNPDTSSPWNWTFDFPNGTGYYEFYSIGNKSGSPNETAPGSADARCYWLENVSIEVTPVAWNIGSTTIGEYNVSTGPYFNLTNEGNVAISIQINATNATNSSTGDVWVVNDTASHNNYTIGFNLTSGDTWTLFNETFRTFATNIAWDSWQTFDLNLTMATTSSKGNPLSLTITFRAVKA